MIKYYNYKNIITADHQKNAIKLVNNLIKCGNWCKEVPSFQTYSNLYTYDEFEIFKKTFVESCFNYLKINTCYQYKIYMWCYVDNIFNSIKKTHDTWHSHEVKGKNKISGIYYLQNFRKETTEFKDFKAKYEPYTWFIYPSELIHRPPRIKSFKNRYAIAADFEF